MGAGAGDHFPHSANICHSFGAALTVLVIVGDEDINGACPSPGFWRASRVWMPILQCSLLWFQQDLAPQTRRDTSTSQVLRSRLIVKRLMDWGGGFDPIMLYEGGAFGN